MRDRNTGKSMGFGFVKYWSIDDAHQAVLLKNQLKIGDKAVSF